MSCCSSVPSCRPSHTLTHPTFSPSAVCDLGSRLPSQQPAQLRMVRVLLAAGADPMARDGSGLTAIHKVCYYAAGPEVVRALLAAGCDPRDRALAHDKSPLEMAANQGHPRWVLACLPAAGLPARSSPACSLPACLQLVCISVPACWLQIAAH